MRGLTPFRKLALSTAISSCLVSGIVSAQIIAEQNFNNLDSTQTQTTDSLTDGNALTNLSAMNLGGPGIGFNTFWYDSRSIGTGPVTVSSDSSDFIGVSSFAGSNSPDVSPSGVAVSTGTEHNFEFNDTDGRIELVFDPVDTAFATGERTLSLDYWINDTGYEADDSLVVSLTDGVNEEVILSLVDTELEASSSADDGTPNWQTLTVNLDQVLAQAELLDLVTLKVSVDTNSSSENIFIDNIKFESTDGPVNAAGTLVINEIDYDQPGTDNAEFVEIKNTSNEAIALGVYSLELYNGSNGGLYNTIVLDDSILSAGDYYVVCADASTVNNCDQDVTPDTNLIQNGAPDAIRLVNTTLAETVDQVSYEGSVVDVVEGTGTESFDSNSIPNVGLSRTPDGTDSNDNNADFAFRCSTPGALNSDQSSNCVAPSEVLISAIQGSGIESPLVGETVTVEAIVVGDFQSGGLGSQGDLRGFYLQEESSDWDTDAKTSEGIYVFDGTSPSVDVAVGDKVVVTGTVAEYFGETQINVTSGSVVKQSSGNTVTPTSLLLPATETITNSDGDLIANLEAYEGMLISFPQSLSVTELYQLDRFGELRLAQGGRFFQFTQNSLPSVSGFQTHLEDIARRNVILDDGLSNQNPDPIRYPAPGLTTDNALRMGDTVTGLTGVVRYSRGSGGSGDEGYRIMPTAEPVFVAENARSEVPEVGGSLKVASFNVLNFFNTLDTSAGACYPSFSRGDCRGADNQGEFDRQLEKTVTALNTIGADVYGLLEIENDYTDGSSSAIATLTSALNATETSCSEFGYVDPGTRIGSDAIAVGMIYCKDTVELASGSTPSILDDSDLEALGMENRAPLFNGYATNRATLATTFTEKASGESLTIAINHFKSKGDSGLADSETCQNTPDSDLNCDQNDGQGFWNQRRTYAAEALSAWLQTFPTGHSDPDFLVMGDLNGYAMEGPVTALIDRGYTNLVTEFHSAGNAYSYVFDGQAGNLDHGLANASLLTQVNDAQDWHINSDEADGLDYNTDFGRNTSLFDGTVPFRSSDHDPLIIGLNLQSIARGDYDQDGDIDRNDMLLLRQHLNANVEPGHPMDWNDDGRITGLDIRLLILQCSNQHCASSN